MRATRILPLLAATALASGIVASSEATTSPGQTTTILVKLSDTGIKVAFGGQEARGVIVIFKTVNSGKKPHDFSLLGKTTPVLKPGGKASFQVALVHRGVFPYRSTVDKGKAFRGSFVVY